MIPTLPPATPSAPPPSLPPSTPPPGRLAGVPQAQPVDLSKRAEALRDVPKQRYDAPPAPDGPVNPEAGAAQVPMRAEAKRASARALLRVVDRLQANVFAVVAKNEDPAMFRMTDAEFNDLAMDLEDGVATMNIQIPWWVGFAIGMAMLMWMNWTRASKIRKERIARERDEARAAAQPPAPPPAPAPKQPGTAVKQPAGHRPGPAPNMVPRALDLHKCEREGCTELVPKGKKFCSTKCNGMAQAAKRRGRPRTPKVAPPQPAMAG